MVILHINNIMLITCEPKDTLLSLNFNINKKYIDQLGMTILTLNDNKT